MSLLFLLAVVVTSLVGGLLPGVLGAVIGSTLLNYWLIPRAGWRGAVAASLVCDALLAVLLWGTLLVLRARERHNATTAPR